ncbi:hypothetical protein RintRC_2898 [Richelia intracellularis]|nr:hypothetical protein RintRC_2898 [Richelia intracellularis]
MAIAISTSAVIPTLIPSPAIAQVFPGQFRRLAISAGAVLPTTYSKDKIVVTPKETKKMNWKYPIILLTPVEIYSYQLVVK